MHPPTLKTFLTNVCSRSGHLEEDTGIRVTGCSDIILTDGDRSCPCADDIRAAILEEYMDAVIHTRSYCSDADSMICHKMSHSSDCELAKSLALMDMESRCGTTDNKSQRYVSEEMHYFLDFHFHSLTSCCLQWTQWFRIFLWRWRLSWVGFINATVHQFSVLFFIVHRAIVPYLAPCTTYSR